MQRELREFLTKTRPGESSLTEFFLALCRSTGLPPDRANERAVEAELVARGLLIEGTVNRGIHRRNGWPARATKHRESDDE
jgi:hypothetical protein